MFLFQTTVKDNTGKVFPAQVAKCDACGGETFHIFVVNGHNHIQCAHLGCGETYCQGGNCNQEKEPRQTSDIEPDRCPYCGSGIIQNGECQKCGL